MNNQQVQMRFQRPRDLEAVETAATLEQWINHFEVYIKREPSMNMFLTSTWNAAAENMGCEAAGTLTVEQVAENLKVFLGHVCSFLKYPYYNHIIKDRSTDFKSICDILREIYHIEKNVSSLFSIARVSKKSAESYEVFYAKIVYLMQQNMAPQGKTVRYITTPAGGDKLSVTNLDHAALIWLMKIDSRLVDKIEVDYATQIREGLLLSELVPQIAKALPNILKKLDGVKNDVLNCIEDLNIREEGDDDTDEESVNIRFNKPGRNRRGRGGGRGSYRGNRGNSASSTGQPSGPRVSYQPQKANQQVCSKCNWLRTFWRIAEVDVNHSDEDCMRQIPKEVRAIIEKEIAVHDQKTSADNDSSQGESNTSSSTTSACSFQRKIATETHHPPQHEAEIKKELENEDSSFIQCQKNTFSEIDLEKLRIAAVQLSKAKTSPKILVTHNGNRLPLLVDEGSELDAIDGDYAEKNDIQVEPSSKTAKAAGNKDLCILGQAINDVVVNTKFASTKVPINLGKAIVIKNLGATMILGEPGKCRNGISTNPRKRLILAEIEGKVHDKPYYDQSSESTICRISTSKITVFPNDSLKLDVPLHLRNCDVLVTPRRPFGDLFSHKMTHVGDTVELESTSPFPINLNKHDQVADIRRIYPTDELEEETDLPDTYRTPVRRIIPHDGDKFKFSPTAKEVVTPDISEIQVDPQKQLSSETRKKFHIINKKYESIFTPTPGRYSGYYGDVDTSINFTEPPIQTRKVSQPNYNYDQKLKLAQKMDELIQAGILMKPEEVGVTAEFISPCLLVPKLEKGQDRLVSDFTSLNRFVKRCAATSPTIQEAKTDLARKKYFAEVDLSNYFFQGGLRREDCSYLAVQHPFLGVHVYTASPQGLKNSSEHSYERLGRVYGDMMQRGQLTRMADGLYPLGDSEEELLQNYEETLRRAELAGFTFKPKKTVVAPRTTIMFGWKLEDGKWSPQEHVISSISRSEKPATIKQMRSFLGSYKQLADCVPNYAVLLSDMEKLVGARSSSERITWTDALQESFVKAKDAIRKCEGIYFPNKTDRLATASDYSHTHRAIGGTLTIIRKVSGVDKHLPAGNFSAVLDKNKAAWLACVGEAYATKMTILHFEHFIRENPHVTVHYTDSMPVVQAWRRMTTGRMSSNPKIAAFLSTMSSVPIRIEHRPGSSLLLPDHASRHPPPPCKGQCAICQFVNEEQDIGDQIRTVQLENGDISLDPASKQVPFLQLATWKNLQSNDGVHTKLHKLIKTGQEPERRRTGGDHTVLKHLHTLYLRENLRIHESGVIMIRTPEGFYGGFAISVPQHLHHAVAFSFHQKLQHPRRSQLVKFLSRYFYITAVNTVVDQITSSCLPCLSTARLPKALISDTTSIPAGLGTNFAADVLERAGQAIFICKEELSQFTAAVITADQTIPSMRDAIVQTTSPLIKLTGAEIRLDAAPAFQSLEKSCKSDPVFEALKLKVVIGRSLNPNKNPIGESTVGEVKRELLLLADPNKPISQATLSLAIRNLNSRVRASGKTAWEMLTSRDAMTDTKTETNDETLKEDLKQRRERYHTSNEKNRAKTRVKIQADKFDPGDIVMHRALPTFDKPRDTFIVVEQKEDLVTIRKMNNQLRMKTYEERAENLVLVFKPSVPRVPPDHNHNTISHEITSEAKETTAPCRQLPDRSARSKAKYALNEQAIAKVISIQRRFNKMRNKKKKIKKKEVWDYLVINPDPVPVAQGVPPAHPHDDHPPHPNQPVHVEEDEDEQIYDHNDSSSNRGEIDEFDIPSSDSTSSEGSFRSVVTSTDYGSIIDEPLTNDPDDAFLHNTAPLSVSSMSPTSRQSLERHFMSSSSESNEAESLTWDHSTDLLADFDVQAQSPSDTANSSDNEVFEPTTRSSTPRRITRSLVMSGEYELTLSPIPFVRNSRLRRPMVRWPTNVPQIADNTPAARQHQSQSRTRRQL